MQFLSMRQGEVTFVANRISGFFKRCFPVSAGDCLKTLFGLFLATASCIILRELNPGDDYMAAVQVIYVLAAFMIARFTQGFLYGTFAAVAGVLLTNFIFTYPYWAFNFTLPGYPVTILCALIVSVTTSTMTARIKEQGQLQLEAEREKMRSNLLRSISHDLRTPLTGIAGASSLIAESGDKMDRESIVSLGKDINEQADWLIQLVENILNMTKIDSGKLVVEKKPEAVEDVINNALSYVKGRRKQRRVEIDIPEEMLLVEMDGKMIVQVIINLLDNAIKHTKEDGFIRIKTEAAPEGVWFSVEDNGTGIEEVIKDRIFDEFVTFRPVNRDTGKGIGLGLAICKAIVTAHGGTIEALNREEGGACFRFYLPFDGHLPEKEQ